MNFLKRIFRKRKPRTSQVIGYSLEKVNLGSNIKTPGINKIMVLDIGQELINTKKGVKTAYLGNIVYNNKKVKNTWLNRLRVKYGFIKIRYDGVCYSVDELHEKFGEGSPILKIKQQLNN